MVGTENGLNLLTGKKEALKHSRKLLFQISRKKLIVYIRVIKEDRMGNLLLGTEDNGLILYNYKENTFKQYQHKEKDPSILPVTW